MTDRGWLSTWSGLSSHARLADTAPQVTVPSLFIHPTADTEIRVHQAREIYANLGAADKTYHEMAGAPHYLEGHRPAGDGSVRRVAPRPFPLALAWRAAALRPSTPALLRLRTHAQEGWPNGASFWDGLGPKRP